MREGKPFFLYFCHYAVHAPFQADKRFPFATEEGKSKDACAFASLVQGMDDSLGKMLDWFEELGIAENTLVIFLGDNGSDAPLGKPHEVASSAPLRGRKGSHYEGGMRVPCIVSWAKPADNPIQRRLPIPGGAIRKEVGAIYDWFPTLLDLLELPVPQGHPVDGESLKDRIRGISTQAAGQQDREFLMHFPHSPHRSDYFTVYRRGDWKLIYHYFPSEASGGSHVQLYDLGRDPYEQKDLAEVEGDRLRALFAGMTERLMLEGALYPEDESGNPVFPSLPQQ